MATLPGAWRYRVSTGTGRPGVSILWLGEVERWICNFYLSVAARKIVWADPSLRYRKKPVAWTLSNQPTNKPSPCFRPLDFSLPSASRSSSFISLSTLRPSLSPSFSFPLCLSLFISCLPVSRPLSLSLCAFFLSLFVSLFPPPPPPLLSFSFPLCLSLFISCLPVSRPLSLSLSLSLSLCLFLSLFVSLSLPPSLPPTFSPSLSPSPFLSFYLLSPCFPPFLWVSLCLPPLSLPLPLSLSLPLATPTLFPCLHWRWSLHCAGCRQCSEAGVRSAGACRTAGTWRAGGGGEPHCQQTHGGRHRTGGWLVTAVITRRVVV